MKSGELQTKPFVLAYNALAPTGQYHVDIFPYTKVAGFFFFKFFMCMLFWFCV